jgi:DNA helicase HerA-like ATPase
MTPTETLYKRQQASQTPPASPAQHPSLETIALPADARGMALGITGSGKSELANSLMATFQEKHPNSRTLILDSKPRFRAEWELNGLSTRVSRRYKGWKRGQVVPGSVVLPLRSQPKAELAQAWKQKHKVVIAQIDDLDYTPWLLANLREFYRTAKDGQANLVYVDEIADFFSTSGTYGKGHPMVQTIRSGREKGIAFLAASQRPRSIPASAMTEASQFYVFELAHEDDWKHLHNHGLPKDARVPDEDHAFFFYSRLRRGAVRQGYFRLNLGG